MKAPLVTVHPAGPDVVAKLPAEIDLANASQVGDELRAALVERSATYNVVDLEGVRYLDSAGVRVLYAAYSELQTRRQGLALAVPASSPIRYLLKVVGLDQIMPVAATIGEALEVLRAQHSL